MKEITIIIVSFKSENAIYNCLSTINKKYPVIVIENSSDIIFKKKIEGKYKNVKCILARKNLGFGKANNIGLYEAKSNYVLLLNPDTKLKKNTVNILIKNANKIKDFALLAPSIVNEKDKNYGYFENKTISKKNKNNPFEVDFIKGFAMFFNKKKLKKIKFFDEKVFLYLEPIAPYRSQVKYITDLSPDKSYCKMEDMLALVQTKHGFKREVVTTMKDLLRMGTPLILNIVKKTFFVIGCSPITTTR